MSLLLLTGATGRVGSSVRKNFTRFSRIHPCSLSRGVDLRGSLPWEVSPRKVSHALNCAAISSRKGCSMDPFSAFALNTRWPVRLALYCREKGIRLVHISTDLVYSGGVPPYTSSSPAVPGSVYGWTKLLGDLFVLRKHPDACVVRTSVLVGRIGGGASTTFTEDILSGRAAEFHVDAFRNHTDLKSFTVYLEKCLVESTSGLILAASPVSMSRASYAYSVLGRDVKQIHRPCGLPGDLTLVPSIQLD